jgi:hypothetical protein
VTWETLGGGETQERNGSGEAVNAVNRMNGLAGGANPCRRLNGNDEVKSGLPWNTWFEPGGNDRRGRFVERRTAAREGNPLKGKPQECFRHETRPGRIGEEQSAERLKKPESAAQPGEANPVLVASPFQSAGGASNLTRGALLAARRLRTTGKGGAGRFGEYVRVGRKVMRGERIFIENHLQDRSGRPHGASGRRSTKREC